jgi:hypothetical protein
MSRHPVIEDSVMLETAALQECIEEFKDRVANGERGMLIYGPPKQGVSTAFRHICDGLEAGGMSFVLRAQALRSDDLPVRVQPDQLWRLMLPRESIQTGYVRRLRDALIRHVEVEAERLHTKHVFVAIDQAENLSLRQWEDLRTFVESLRIERRLSVFCLVAGQSELLAVADRMRRTLRHTLIAEFLLGPHRFRGVRLDELNGVLSDYDALRYPMPDGASYTQHFCPGLWRRGVRLVQLADPMRQRFAKILSASGTGTQELPMAYVASAVRRFLYSAEEAAPQEISILAELAARCVDKCGLREALETLGNPEVDARRKSRRLRRLEW